MSKYMLVLILSSGMSATDVEVVQGYTYDTIEVCTEQGESFINDFPADQFITDISYMCIPVHDSAKNVVYNQPTIMI